MSEATSETCPSCGHKCVVAITAKCRDQFAMRWPGGREQRGYVPPHKLLGLRENEASSDYLNFHLCLVCGHVPGNWPTEPGKKHLSTYAEPRYWEAILCLGGREGTGVEPTWLSCWFLSKTRQAVEDYIEQNPEEFENPVEVFVKDVGSGENILDGDRVWEV